MDRASPFEVWHAAVDRVTHFGTRVYCPICGKHSAKFRDFGHIVRKNAECVWCGSLERHRFLWKYFEKSLLPRIGPSPGKFLHFAPEKCFRPRFRQLFGKGYITADLYLAGVDYRVDITKQFFNEGEFGLVYCSHVLEHVTDDRAAMREVYRVLAPGGVALIAVPIDPTLATTLEDSNATTAEDRARLFGQHDHVRQYVADFPDRLRAAGFAVSTIRSQDLLIPAEMHYLGIRRDHLYVCGKGR